MFSTCTKGHEEHITGDYTIWEGMLTCQQKLSSETMVAVGVRRVEWNERAIVLHHRSGGAERYSIVWDSGQQVRCATGDELIGPLTLSGLKAERRRLGIEAYLGRGEPIGSRP
jgi:hypothetical protein